MSTRPEFEHETTWGQLRKADGVKGKDGMTWVLQADPVIKNGKAQVHIKKDRTVLPYSMPVDQPVTVVQYRADRPLSERFGLLEMSPEDVAYAEQVEAEANRVQDAFGEDKVELIASETDEEQRAREAATPERPLVLPILESPLTLRAHLYIFHGFYVAEETNGMALKEHHRKCHEHGQIKAPHVHKEST